MEVRYSDWQYPLRDGRWASRVRLKFWGDGRLTVHVCEPRSVDVGIFATEQGAIAFNKTLAAVALSRL